MKAFRKTIAILVSAVLMAMMLPFTFACSSDNKGPSDTPVTPGEKIEYTVTLQRSSGNAFKGATVIVRDGDSNVKDYGYTDDDGKVTFNLPAATYSLEFGGVLPEGYNGKGDYTMTAEQPDVTFKLAASLIDKEAPASLKYEIGSVMHNFEFTDTTGKKSSLADILAVKKAVLINFWYINCYNCVEEFPGLKKAYQRYANDIEVLGLNPFDGKEAAESFRVDRYDEYGWDILPFVMVSSEQSAAGSVATAFGIDGYPTSIIVDREGVVCFIGKGGAVEEEFTELFATYTAEPYVQKIYFPGVQALDRPDVAAPSSAEIQQAINNTGSGFNFSYYFEDDEYNWPWVVSDDGKSVYTSNTGHHNAYAIMHTDITAVAEQVIAFEYKLSTEADYDNFYVFINGEIVRTYSGESNGWKTCCAFVPESAGTYKLSLVYIKDGDRSRGDDTVHVRNMHFATTADITERTEVIYPCASGTKSDNGKYSNYVSAVYNKADGYYHVGTADGPLVIADLMNTTNWDKKNNAYSYVNASGLIYDLDNDGTPEDYTDLITHYAQISNCSVKYGKAAVTEDLRTCLEALTAKISAHHHADQWLELCSYYKVFGGEAGEQIADPAIGLADHNAYPTKLTTGNTPVYNHVVKRTLIMPRGVWFKFVPERTAIYKVYTVGEIDSYGWIRDESLNIIAENDDEPETTFVGTPEEAGNFAITLLMTAGKPYYILCDYNDVDTFGEFDFVIKLLATEGDVWTHASGGDYDGEIDKNGNLVGDLFVRDAVEYVLGDDNCYHVKNADGTAGPLLYINMTSTTYMFTSMAIKDMPNIECYYCKSCGSKYYGSVKAFEAEDDPACGVCPATGKNNFAKLKSFELPDPLIVDGEIFPIKFEYEDTTYNLVPMYLLDTDLALDPRNYSRDIKLYGIKFNDYTDVINRYIADSQKAAYYPSSPDEVGSGKTSHPGFIAASKELVDILQKFILFGDYAYSPMISNAWLMLSCYYLHLG